MTKIIVFTVRVADGFFGQFKREIAVCDHKTEETFHNIIVAERHDISQLRPQLIFDKKFLKIKLIKGFAEIRNL